MTENSFIKATLNVINKESNIKIISLLLLSKVDSINSSLNNISQLYEKENRCHFVRNTRLKKNCYSNAFVYLHFVHRVNALNIINHIRT